MANLRVLWVIHEYQMFAAIFISSQFLHQHQHLVCGGHHTDTDWLIEQWAQADQWALLINIHQNLSLSMKL